MTADAQPAAERRGRLGRWLRSRVIRYGRRALDGWNALACRHAPHGDHPLFPLDQFPWARDVEAGFAAVRAELDRVLAGAGRIPDFAEISADQAHLAPAGTWQTFFLHAYGFRADRNCRRCPDTAALVERIPGMKTAFFSILRPGAAIAPHRGPYKGLLRLHLGLRVPSTASADCGIRVGDRVAGWREAACLIFDDTYEHEAWNRTDADRVVLFVDFERPLPAPLAALNRLLIAAIARSPFIRDAVENFERLDRDAA